MKDEEVQAYLMQLEEYEKNMNALANQQELMRKSLDEHLKVLETLKNFATLEKDTEILIPLGAGVFLPGNSKNMDRVIINIGGNIFMEANMEKATDMVGKRVNNIKEAIEKISRQMAAIEREAGKITNLLREEEEKRLGGNA
ncbi:MAG: prefoldin subunit alpha [Thermoplasmata archaeon]|nr:prefoldin subunit alpha [Thermoplasmata archaeon]